MDERGHAATDLPTAHVPALCSGTNIARLDRGKASAMFRANGRYPQLVQEIRTKWVGIGRTRIQEDDVRHLSHLLRSLQDYLEQMKQPGKAYHSSVCHLVERCESVRGHCRRRKWNVGKFLGGWTCHHGARECSRRPPCEFSPFDLDRPNGYSVWNGNARIC